MFKVVTAHLFWWPVTVRMPDPEKAGELLEEQFEMRFEAITRERFGQMRDELAAIPEKDRSGRVDDLVLEFARDWRGVVDAGGVPIPFSRELLVSQLGFPWFRDAVEGAYFQAARGEAARLGN